MFTFKTKTGEEIEFPHFADCSSDAMRLTRKIEDEADRVFTMIELGFGEDSEELKNLGKISNGELPDFIKKFMGGLDSKK